MRTAHHAEWRMACLTGRLAVVQQAAGRWPSAQRRGGGAWDPRGTAPHSRTVLGTFWRRVSENIFVPAGLSRPFRLSTIRSQRPGSHDGAWARPVVRNCWQWGPLPSRGFLYDVALCFLDAGLWTLMAPDVCWLLSYELTSCWVFPPTLNKFSCRLIQYLDIYKNNSFTKLNIYIDRDYLQDKFINPN